MITIALVSGGFIVGGGIIATFWKKVQSWLIRVYEKISTKIEGTIQGVRIALVKLQEGAREISKNYAKVGTKWQETIVYRSVEINEIPEKYRDRLVLNQEVDYTEEFESLLQLQH